MRDKMKAPYVLSAALAALMVFQSVLGLVFQEQYRDVDWIKATWFGNDWVTLVVTVPLVEPEAFKLVAALDISLMVTGLTFGGVLLWRRNTWGYVVAAIASIQASLYLLVLSVSSIVGIQRGLAESPGEVPLWATLAVFTTAVTLLLLTNVRRERAPLLTGADRRSSSADYGRRHDA